MLLCQFDRFSVNKWHDNYVDNTMVVDSGQWTPLESVLQTLFQKKILVTPLNSNSLILEPTCRANCRQCISSSEWSKFSISRFFKPQMSTSTISNGVQSTLSIQYLYMLTLCCYAHSRQQEIYHIKSRTHFSELSALNTDSNIQCF